ARDTCRQAAQNPPPSGVVVTHQLSFRTVGGAVSPRRSCDFIAIAGPGSSSEAARGRAGTKL
ncbi:MAG TPA: hypothetical protein PLF91_08645, partial [Mycolicibacterium fallax]|nr:hypothetical protein [Mycolicibacterium fallax]